MHVPHDDAAFSGDVVTQYLHVADAALLPLAVHEPEQLGALAEQLLLVFLACVMTSPHVA